MVSYAFMWHMIWSSWSYQ